MRRPSAPVPAGADPTLAAGHPPATDEVVTVCRDLLRMDTSNYGDSSGPGERQAAEYVAGLLAEVQLEPQVFESEPGRTSVIARFPGADSSRPALLVHGHLDVVPAQKDDWRIDPFSGEIADDCLWGRGAVDMKDMDAIILSTVRQMRREGRKPPRDIVLAFMADEEAGGVKGSHWLVRNHPGLFEGVDEAVSEVGGFSVELQGRRTYLLQSAEKGIAWVRLVAKGRAGHGSQVNTDNAITHLAEAIGRIGAHRWPTVIPATVRAFFEGVREQTGVELLSGEEVDVDKLREMFGTTARWLEATVQNTANPTVLEAGYKHNVIPGSASALVDCRYLPGQKDELMRTLAELAGEHVEVEVLHGDVALEAGFEGGLVDAMKQSLLELDPGAAVLPYCLSGGTDNKAFSQLGIRGYGFAPLKLPADLDFAGMFHSVDERVPLESLRFGVRTFDRFLQLA
ncbi:M20/M25/M40 family metallo-hydrolase [Kineosporia sp. J2-2]|uniref:M20/M25/M40 family metallo-hydrolase n=1 Tax=Kineosporia corallincola TaxID=2835133 RepID=A0ABS5TLC9_9ACTN|nr:M20/M25/M40 family metallo-hydrolase [Kineosporia corallincola]MBT0771915.1 M20/M25/M40 family metallo-hydrolase [Kineosporia corallincola]